MLWKHSALRLTAERTAPKLTVCPSFVLLFCVLFRLDRDGWVPLFLCSAALHECGHLAALRLCRVPVFGIELRAGGAVIHTGVTGAGREAVCTAAGPLVNLVLAVAFFHAAPRSALVNLLLLCFNLLPVYPLDGGRLLRLLLCRLFPKYGEQITQAVAYLFVLSAAVLAVVQTCVLHRGLYPCLIAALLICRLPNTPCKIAPVRLK